MRYPWKRSCPELPSRVPTETARRRLRAWWLKVLESRVVRCIDCGRDYSTVDLRRDLEEWQCGDCGGLVRIAGKAVR